MRVQRFDTIGRRAGIARRGPAGAGVDAGVIDALQTKGKLGIEFFQTAGSLAGQAQAGLKILLYNEEHAFGFHETTRSATTRAPKAAR